MKLEQLKWSVMGGWQGGKVSNLGGATPQLVLAFGARSLLVKPEQVAEIKAMYPQSAIVFASTAGEISNEGVSDNTIVLSALYFEKTQLKFVETDLAGIDQSEEAGKILAGKLDSQGLVHAMVFSEGLKVNGTALVQGITKTLPASVSVTGGLVGDGADFKETVVGLNDVPTSGKAVLVGFYGTDLKVGYGSLGGWDPFGPDRVITKSKGNILYELDGENALDLYKKYLGDQAKDLPGSGLLFPMNLKTKNDSNELVEVVRTLLGIDEANGGLIFAGDMPEGSYTQLMKANFDRLVDGAIGAASGSVENLGKSKPDFAILISCIGRKLVLKDRIDEEIEGVLSVVGEDTLITGFYSYGELCPTAPTEKQCRLHNQTMTITTFRE